MSRGLARESSVSVVITYLYLGILAALFAGVVSFIHSSFQPIKLANPGMAAYHVPAALELYPPPRLYSSPAPEIDGDAEPQPASSNAAASTEPAQREPAPKSTAPKKRKQTASRLRGPPAPYYSMTPAQFFSYGYAGPGERH
jgi:hypothetical protein